ncbi:MAG: hypothetical protein EXR29_06825 [Betaproteobacteria bacterium]|nr:hypothetical protein [Betaproteobacteria bacterium]
MSNFTIPRTYGSADCLKLANYIERQLDNLFPVVDGEKDHIEIEDVAKALERFFNSAIHIRRWCDPLEFSPIETEKNAQFLYLLANSTFRRRGAGILLERLFALNKALNGFTCYYTTILPEIFFVSHSVGVVLGKASYSDYLVVFQGSTVGRIGENCPALDRGVILFPNAVVAGNSKIGPNTFISANVSIINREIKGNAIVAYAGTDITLIQPSRNILGDYFVL